MQWYVKNLGKMCIIQYMRYKVYIAVGYIATIDLASCDVCCVVIHIDTDIAVMN